MDWLKILGFIIPSIAIVLSLNARLKTFNNERISVYKDMKSLSSELKMESHEIRVIDNELKKLILREVTGVAEFNSARRLMKILSCNPSIEETNKRKLKKIIQCIREKEHSPHDGCINIKFELNKELYKRKTIEGVIYITAFFVGYITLLTAGFMSIAGRDFIWASIQITMSFTLLIAMTITKASYPALWNYKKHAQFTNSLKEYKKDQDETL